MKRREFIEIVVGAVGAGALIALPLPADPASRMLETFHRLRVSREGQQPDIALSRMERTIADLRCAGIEIVRTQVETARDVDGTWRPPVGFAPRFHCIWHEWALAGSWSRRKLRCLICETEELDEEWIRNPFLMRGGFYRVVATRHGVRYDA